MAHASTAIYPRRSVFSSSATIRTMPSGSLIPHHSDLHLVVDLELLLCSGIGAPSHTSLLPPGRSPTFSPARISPINPMATFQRICPPAVFILATKQSHSKFCDIGLLERL